MYGCLLGCPGVKVWFLGTEGIIIYWRVDGIRCFPCSLVCLISFLSPPWPIAILPGRLLQTWATCCLSVSVITRSFVPFRPLPPFAVGVNSSCILTRSRATVPYLCIVPAGPCPSLLLPKGKTFIVGRIITAAFLLPPAIRLLLYHIIPPPPFLSFFFPKFSPLVIFVQNSRTFLKGSQKSGIPITASSWSCVVCRYVPHHSCFFSPIA